MGGREECESVFAYPATWGEALAQAAGELTEAGVETARLDAGLLLGYLLNVSRAALLASPERELTPEQARAYAGLVRRRRAREPLAYITGTRDWLDMTLQVDSRVLIPRPETELLAERVIARGRHRQARLAVDVGTGSGALAIALARHLPGLQRVIAIDLSPAALQVAEINCRAQGVGDRVALRQGSLLDPLRDDERPDLLVANLPYIPHGELSGLQPEVRDHEPRLALVGGRKGDELIGHLLRQAQARLAPGATIYLELHHDQGEAVASLAGTLWSQAVVAVYQDYSGLDRIVEITLL